jgi:hypothetical protein
LKGWDFVTNDSEKLDGYGPLYRVKEVAGHPPGGLDDLIGATTVTVEHERHEYRLIGTGVKVDQTVRFHEKEAGSALDTGPVWMLTDDGAGGLSAQPLVPD